MYERITSLENLFGAWGEFLKGKRKKKDVELFAEDFSGSICNLHFDLKNKIYTHSAYSAFNISDPKPRNIHKASVRDRLLHHAIYRVLYPYFDKRFISDSYSCRLNKGTHKAVNRFKAFAYKVSKNNTETCWVLKCDIKKFFASIDHNILLQILKKHIEDVNTIWLLKQIIDSFSPGLPLGNLTSQLLVNIYMNEFDYFVKHKLKTKYYIRYADDFVLLSLGKSELLNNIRYIERYLNDVLKLELHPDKVFVKNFASGVDFLGWVHFPKHRVLRATTKRRMLKSWSEKSRSSYLGMLRHGNTHKLQNLLK